MIDFTENIAGDIELDALREAEFVQARDLPRNSYTHRRDERPPPCQDELVPAFLETLCTRGARKDRTTWRPRPVRVTA